MMKKKTGEFKIYLKVYKTIRGSIFYTVVNLSNSILKKIKKSTYEKDHVFSKLYDDLEDKNIYQQNDKLPLVTPFVDKKVTLIV